MQDIALLNTIGAKIDYLSRRQELIAQNVANADTPGYRPQDLRTVDFGALLGQNAGLTQTQPNHLTPGAASLPGTSAQGRPQKMTYEVAPAGNAVILEEQLVKAGANKMDYDLMVNLYTKNMQMLRTALGTGR